MPLPTPDPREKEGEFLNRCMGDPVMVQEYEDPEQRYAVCMSQWAEDKERN